MRQNWQPPLRLQRPSQPRLPGAPAKTARIKGCARTFAGARKRPLFPSRRPNRWHNPRKCQRRLSQRRPPWPPRRQRHKATKVALAALRVQVQALAELGLAPAAALAMAPVWVAVARPGCFQRPWANCSGLLAPPPYFRPSLPNKAHGFQSWPKCVWAPRVRLTQSTLLKAPIRCSIPASPKLCDDGVTAP